MQINFNLPHVLSPSASPAEREAVLSILSNAVTKLRKVHGASHAAIASAPSGMVNGSKRIYAFHLPTFFYPLSTQTTDDKALRILLDALTDINSVYYRFHPNTPSLYPRKALPVFTGGPVIYGRTQIWDPIPALYHRGYGDCKSLSAALIADYRQKGIEAYPVFRWVRADGARKKKNETNYHILVQTAQGFEDPSKVLGMGKDALY